MATVLAIDASTTAVGWAVFRDGEYVESGVYKPADNNPWKRIALYEGWLRTWFVSAESQAGVTPAMPDIVAYELATGNRGNMRVNRLMGGLEYVTRRTVPYFSRFVAVTASQVRASGCHKNALAVASAIAGKEITSGDEADSIGVYLAACAKSEALRAAGALEE